MVDLGVLIAAARVVHATRSPLGLPPAPEIAAQAMASLTDTLALLDARLSDGHPFLAGERVTIADCTLAAGLQFARFGELRVADRYDHVRAGTKPIVHVRGAGHAAALESPYGVGFADGLELAPRS